MSTALPCREAVLKNEIAIVSRALTLSPHDPADSFLPSTAQMDLLTLVASNERLIEGRMFRDGE